MPVSDLVHILTRLANHVDVVGGGENLVSIGSSDKVRVFPIRHATGRNLISRIFNYIITQTKIFVAVIAETRSVDLFVFFLGGEAQVLPMLAAKVLGKKVVLAPGGSSTDVLRQRRDPALMFVEMGELFNLLMADRIVLYSERLAHSRAMSRFLPKVRYAHHHAIDFSRFQVTTPLTRRENVIGFVGRMAEEKGILNFAKTIPRVVGRDSSVKFAIYGDGPLLPVVRKYLEELNLGSKVSINGWIAHEQVPQALNQLKLLVVPSYTEGLPGIVLEAMACGTPVLAAAVGGIPDIIESGVTGILVGTNHPSVLAESILETMHQPGLLDQISLIARRTVDIFEPDAAAESWRLALEGLAH